MCNTTRHIIKWLCLSALLCVSVSCSKEMDAPDTPDVPSGEEMTLHIGFKVPTRAAAERYEDGETDENYIDIAGGNYRIYFFDGNDKFIASFEPSGFIATEGSDYCHYSVLGKAPDALVEHSDFFKMVVLANWPSYPESLNKDGGENLPLVEKETTIEEICTADWAQYDCLTDGKKNPTAIALDPFAANPNERKLMPFYGVHEYKNITFTPGQATRLKKPVTLLRAMAKVEVILETDDDLDLSFSSVAISRYNERGYCAPEKVFTQDEYDHDGDPENDYVKELHLTNEGKNDEDEKELVCRSVRMWTDKDGTRHEKWEAYIPEYKNIDVGDTYSCIKVKLDDVQTEPYTIFFANYDGGQTDNSDRLNIERNNIYRFIVTVHDSRFKVNVQEWKYAYDNEYTFD